MDWPGFQDNIYGRLASRRVTRRGALWLRNVATQVLAHRLAPSISHDRNGEALLINEFSQHVGVAIDVGANVGDWTGYLLDAAPAIKEVVCYEPGATSLGALRGRFGENQRVKIVAAAVSDIAGEQEFFDEPNAGQTSSLIASHSQARAEVRRVPVVTIDEEIDRLKICHVDLLKIDAEGMDLHVLRGAERALADRRISVAQFEYNAPWAAVGSTLAAAFRLLQGYGYDVRALLPDGLHSYSADDVGELFVYSNFVAFLPEIFPSSEGIDLPAF